MSGDGFTPQTNDLAQVTVGSDGRLDVPVSIPDDVGGLHGLVLRAGDRMLARTHFVIETSIVSMTPASGPAGTPVTIHLKGVGWTEYDNIYIATYDNAYMGYACGFNSQGDVVINFTAAGPPGVHLIDLYPGIYQGPPTEPQLLYRTPQLTYADDHPGNKIPALRFAFEVTPSVDVRHGVTTRLKKGQHMTVGCKRAMFAPSVFVLVGLLGLASVAGQAAQEPAQPMAENVFKNIQVLKGIPADEFMDTMGMFASSLVYDCTGCHVEEILTGVRPLP